MVITKTGLTQICSECDRELEASRFMYGTNANGLLDQCRTCQSWRKRSKIPPGRSVEFENSLDEIIRKCVAVVMVRYRCALPDVLTLHRSEIEQKIWEGMREADLLKDWRVPIWVHPSSLKR